MSHPRGQCAVLPDTQRDLFDEPEISAHTATGLFAEIVFNRPLDHAFTYSVPESLRGAISVGKRVLAPFGKGDRSTIGFCVGLLGTGPERTIKELVSVVDDEVLLTPGLLRLTRWMADYYLCGWGQVLNAVVPAGARDLAGSRATTMIRAVDASALPDPLPMLSPKQQAAFERLRAATAPMLPKQLAREAGCGLAPIEALIEKGLARRVVQRRETFIDSTQSSESLEPPVSLNADQLRAWAPVEAAVRQGGFQAFLLYGVTGSGKTEIYLRAIEEVIRQGKEAIVLVPEISLTPQTIQRFRGRCGDVAVLHSHLRDAERGGQWRRISSGLVQVVVGARSALFAPTRRLGLIVIDEEHENTFKQETTPRYHARDVAVMRARLEGIPIILGSATPSLESWHNAERGQYRLLELPNRVLERPLPHVALIDLRHEPPPRGRFFALSRTLERAMHDALRTGGQVILLLNRRGYATHLHCPACGHVEMCRFCDLALTFHQDRRVALCHYCGYEAKPPERCPKCGQMQVRYQGLGTEKLQAEIEEKFHGFVARRMDSDSMKQKGSHERVLSAFRQGLIHILFGTQMIAKGLDFPNVTLVGVVNADVGLHIPDFRSAERTFQLLAQVSGRAGRGPQGGRVLVQSYNPELPCVALASRHDYRGFVVEELKHRRAHNYPPYQRLARLIVRSKDPARARAFADHLAAAINAAVRNLRAPRATAGEMRILGPAEAPVFRLKGFYRFHFQIQSPSAATLHELLRAVLPSARTPAGVEFTLDVDPLNML